MSMTVLPLIGDIIIICPVISPWNTKWHDKTNTSHVSASSAATRTWAAPTDLYICWMIIVSASSCVMAISTPRENAPWLISTGIGSLPVTMIFPFSTSLWDTKSATISSINCFLLLLTVSTTVWGGNLDVGRRSLASLSLLLDSLMMPTLYMWE